MAELIKGEAPIKDYDEMELPEITEQLHFLTDAEMLELEGYEKSHQHRPDVVREIERELALRKHHAAR